MRPSLADEGVVYWPSTPADSCKFLHDRSDYKSGWQLEKEWKDKEYGKEGEPVMERFQSNSVPPRVLLLCRYYTV